MRFKILLICLMALGLLVACQPHRPPSRFRLAPKQPTPVSGAAKPAPKFIGIYKHLALAADAPAIDSTLYLNTDGSFKLIDEYVGKATNTQIGTWAANSDGRATITTTGQLEGVAPPLRERKFDKPVIEQVRFTDDSDETLKVAGDKSSQWTRFEALVQDYTKATYDPAAATQAVQTRGWAGLYKAALPAADCCGLDITLFLNADKSAEFRSDYLNGKAPILAVGSWTASATVTLTSTAPVTVTVTLTGQKGKPAAAKPQILALILQDGVLLTSKTSTILPNARLKLYSADGLIAPERAAFTAQPSVETPAVPKMPHYPKHLPFWVRFLMLVEHVCQKLLDMHFSDHSFPNDFKLPTT